LATFFDGVTCDSTNARLGSDARMPSTSAASRATMPSSRFWLKSLVPISSVTMRGR